MNITNYQRQAISPDIIMVKTLAGALALAALPSALAFRNTSPFFLFSTAEYACSAARPSQRLVANHDAAC